MIGSSNHLCSFERIWSWIRSNSLCSMNATNAWTKLTCERSSRWAGMLKLGVVSGRSTRNIFFWEKIYVETVKSRKILMNLERKQEKTCKSVCFWLKRKLCSDDLFSMAHRMACEGREGILNWWRIIIFKRVMLCLSKRYDLNVE